jgi:hypothetical protein
MTLILAPDMRKVVIIEWGAKENMWVQNLPNYVSCHVGARESVTLMM